MKKQLLKSALIAVVGIGLMAGSASAVLVSTTYTADNIVDTFYLQHGDIASNLAAGASNGDWKVADTFSQDLSAGVKYSYIWKLTNDEIQAEMSATNPAGFLAEIDFGGSENLLSNITWTYAVNKPGKTTVTNFNHENWVWSQVTAYGHNGELGKIWTDVLGGPVAGISTQAQWIWSGDNSTADGDTEVFIRADFAPVPEPTTMLLFGSGLLGFAAIARRRRG